MSQKSIGIHPRPFHKKLAPTAYISSLNAKYELLEKDKILITRSLSITKPTVIHDIIGKLPVFLSSHLESSGISFVKDQIQLNINPGNYCGWLPPFSIIEWHIPPGNYNVSMIVLLEGDFSKHSTEPLLISHQEANDNILSLLNMFLNKTLSGNSLNINRVNKHCSLSTKVYDYLIKNYDKKINFTELAKKFKTSPAVLSRYFKKSHGMSPIKALNKIRVMSSLKTLFVDKSKVLDVSTQLGYSDVRLFNEHFSHIIGDKPSSFL